MRFKKWAAVLLLLLITALLLHYLLYYTRLRFYRPVRISIKTFSVSDSTSAVQGITPFGRVYHYPYNKTNKNWSTGYVFLKDIIITIDTALLTDRMVLTLNTGGENHYYGSDELLNLWQLKEQNGQYLTFALPAIFSDKSFFGSFLSVFRWRITLILMGILFIAVMVFYIRIRWRGILIVLPTFRRKAIIVLGLIYLILLWGIYTEFKRFSTQGAEGIGLLNAMLFLIYVFFMFHLVIEVFFIFWGTSRVSKQNIRLLYGSFFFMLILAEFILRGLGIPSTYSEDVFGTYSQSNFKPPSNKYLATKESACLVLKKKEFAFYRRFNSDGLPDAEHRIEKDSSIFRVIALGDSFTEGEGTPQDSTWVNFLKYRTLAEFPAKQFEFFNAGISGSDPFYSYLLLQDKLLKYHPDLVLFTINTTDISDYFYRNGFERFRTGDSIVYNKPPRWEWLYAYSYISRLFIHGILGYDKHFVKITTLNERTSRALQALHDVAVKLDSLGNKHHFKPVIVLHPQYIETARNQYVCDTFEKTFKNDTTLTVADMLDYFRKAQICTPDSADVYYWPVDRHHNTKGYKLFADGVFEFLITNQTFCNPHE